MKRIFTLGILFLLSVTATTNLAWAKGPLKSATAATALQEPEFSSADDSNEIWYYIRFVRRAADNKVWTTDYPTNNNSWGVKQLVTMTTGDKTTQYWKLVGDRDQFYIVNRATGFKIAFLEVADPEKGVPDGNSYIVDADGGPGAQKLKLMSSRDFSSTLAENWVIVNTAISSTAFMNDRAGNNVCHYGSVDNGFMVEFVYAEKQSIAVSSNELAIETPVNYTGKGLFSGISGFNMETTTITATIEGDDASHFSFLNGENTVTGGTGSLTVTFTPQEIRQYSATLVLSGGNADPVSVRLVGKAFNAGDLPKISTEDNSDEHWYYIQFFRKAAANTVWSLSDTTAMVIQDTLKVTNIRADQQWKICGSWDEYYFINKATGEEMTYNRTASADGSKPASRYVRAAAGVGDLFGFVRFSDTDAWQLYNWSTESTSKYVNDQGGRHLTGYSKNDAGCRLTFIPADEPSIITSVSLIAFDAFGEHTATVKVSGLNLTSNITATIKDGEGAFSFGAGGSTLPATGGVLEIICNPNIDKSYKTVLTLTSGTISVDVTLRADPITPEISTDQMEVWYYIQFSRRPALAWTVVPNEEGRYNTRILQKAYTDGVANTEQYWKLVGDEENGYSIISKNGGAFNFDETAERIILTEENAADLFQFRREDETSRWELELVSKIFVDDDGDSYGYLNDYNATDIGLYYPGDGGNTLNFIFAERNVIDGIIAPKFNANDKVVAVKYYNLMGQEVVRPATSGIYIVRNIYASGQTKASKQIFIIK